MIGCRTTPYEWEAKGSLKEMGGWIVSDTVNTVTLWTHYLDSGTLCDEMAFQLQITHDECNAVIDALDEAEMWSFDWNTLREWWARRAEA